MVGTFSQRFACVASEPNGVERHCFMKPSSWDKPLGWYCRRHLRRAKATKPITPLRMRRGWMQVTIPASLRGRGEAFFLDILFQCVPAEVSHVQDHCIAILRHAVQVPLREKSRLTSDVCESSFASLWGGREATLSDFGSVPRDRSLGWIRCTTRGPA
jgi:hypothetical protein